MPNWLIKNALTVHLRPPAIQATDIRIVDGKIAEVGPNLKAGANELSFDALDKIVLPGWVNAHTHLYSTLARGMPGPAAPPRNFLEILQEIWWRMDRALDEESIYYSALIGGIEAVKSGTTTLVDHHASPAWIRGSLGVIKQALSRIGVRAVLCYETTDRGGERERDLGLEENDDFLRHQTDAMFRGLVGAHASFTLSDESLRACTQLASEHDCGVHMHLAEDPCDAEISRTEFHRDNLVRALDEIGALSEKTVLAHGIHLSADDLEIIKQRRCWLMHNARSNMNNSVGHAPVHRFGQRVALGTDGFPADMLEEAQIAFFRGREAKNGLGPEDYLAFLSAGHQLCAEIFGETFGRIAPGAVADLIMLDYESPTPLTAENLAGHLLFGMKAGHLTEVMIAGRFVLQDKELPDLDVSSIYQESRNIATRLWKRLQSRR